MKDHLISQNVDTPEWLNALRDKDALAIARIAAPARIRPTDIKTDSEATLRTIMLIMNAHLWLQETKAIDRLYEVVAETRNQRRLTTEIEFEEIAYLRKRQEGEADDLAKQPEFLRAIDAKRALQPEFLADFFIEQARLAIEQPTKLISPPPIEQLWKMFTEYHGGEFDTDSITPDTVAFQFVLFRDYCEQQYRRLRDAQAKANRQKGAVKAQKKKAEKAKKRI